MNSIEEYVAALRGLKGSDPDVVELMTLFHSVRMLRRLSPDLDDGSMLDPLTRLFERLQKEVTGKSARADISVEFAMLSVIAGFELLQTQMSNDAPMKKSAAIKKVLEKCPQEDGILAPIAGSAGGRRNRVDKAAIERWEGPLMTDGRLTGKNSIKDRMMKHCLTHDAVLRHISEIWKNVVPIRELAQREYDQKNSAIS